MPFLLKLLELGSYSTTSSPDSWFSAAGGTDLLNHHLRTSSTPYSSNGDTEGQTRKSQPPWGKGSFETKVPTLESRCRQSCAPGPSLRR